MNVLTGLSVYNKKWMVEPSAAKTLLTYWHGLKGTELTFNAEQATGKTRSSIPVMMGATVAPQSSFDMKDFDGFEGATTAIIPISGPLMKDDYCGSLGTSSIKSLTRMAANTTSVNTILYVMDSPGGTVDGTEALANEIKAAGSTKRTVALVDGDMCSAAYWIGSACSEVYASNQTDHIGSIGTMCQVVDDSEYNEKMGVVIHTYYATGSQDKNAVYTEAEKGNGKKLIAEMLDPLNDVFHAAVATNRPQVISTAMTGKVYTAQNAIGMGLIDGIKSIEQILQPKSIINKSKYMTIEQLKADHPAVYEAAKQEGVTSEQTRTNTWLVWDDVDPKAVSAGIKSGNTLDPVAQAEFGKKMFAKQGLAGMEDENPQVLQTATPTTPKAEEARKVADFRAEVMNNLKIAK